MDEDSRRLGRTHRALGTAAEVDRLLRSLDMRSFQHDDRQLVRDARLAAHNLARALALRIADQAPAQTTRARSTIQPSRTADGESEDEEFSWLTAAAPYLTREEWVARSVRLLGKPSAETVQLVHDWLESTLGGRVEPR